MVSVYWMDTRFGMKDYEYIGELNILEADALFKCCEKDHKKGVFWRFVRDGKVFFGVRTK